MYNFFKSFRCCSYNEEDVVVEEKPSENITTSNKQSILPHKEGNEAKEGKESKEDKEGNVGKEGYDEILVESKFIRQDEKDFITFVYSSPNLV